MAYTTLATQSAGQTASAANWANLVKGNFEAIMPIARVRATADVNVSLDATVNADTQLLFPVGANEEWIFNSVVGITSGAGGYRFTWTAPSGAAGAWHLHGTDSQSVHTFGIAFATEHAVGSAVTDEPFTFSGVVVNGATPGNVTFAWAQSASNAANTTRRIHSWLIANRVA